MSTHDPGRALVVLLDTGPLGMVTHPKGGREAEECKDWLALILSMGVDVLVLAIADYELLRELIRSRKVEGLARLDSFIRSLGYVPIDQDFLNDAWVPRVRYSDPVRSIPPGRTVSEYRTRGTRRMFTFSQCRFTMPMTL